MRPAMCGVSRARFFLMGIIVCSIGAFGESKETVPSSELLGAISAYFARKEFSREDTVTLTIIAMDLVTSDPDFVKVLEIYKADPKIFGPVFHGRLLKEFAKKNAPRDAEARFVALTEFLQNQKERPRTYAAVQNHLLRNANVLHVGLLGLDFAFTVYDVYQGIYSWKEGLRKIWVQAGKQLALSGAAGAVTMVFSGVLGAVAPVVGVIAGIYVSQGFERLLDLAFEKLFGVSKNEGMKRAFKVLKLSLPASALAVKEAYMRLTANFVTSDSPENQMTEEMTEVHMAYEFLRAHYMNNGRKSEFMEAGDEL